MPLYSLPQSELREHCRRSIEGLELWLRRLVHDTFSDAFGPNYIDAVTAKGDRLIRCPLADRLKRRMAAEPARYSRPIDAAVLDDLIDLLCNPPHYKAYFATPLADAFPDGSTEARTFLRRLAPPRNALAHANPITVHDAHRVLCYALDVVEALKRHYVEMNKAQLYNVPTVIRIVDSLGHAVDLSASAARLQAEIHDYSNDPPSFLRSGSTLSIEVDVDPAFDPADYEIRWSVASIAFAQQLGRRFSLRLEERYVMARLCVVCWVTSKKSWHKFGTHDDQVEMAYRVLPPP